MPARPKNRITAQDLYRLQLISDVRISPDGEHVAYVERSDRNVWVIGLPAR